MSSSLKLITFGLLCVSCLPDPDPGSYYFSKTVWVTDTEVPTYKTKKLDKGGKTVVEVKTGSNPIDSSNGAFLTQFFSPDGTSCTMRDLDNPQTNDLESGKVDQFTGSMLGPCENYHPEKISSVKITHTSGDGWRGEYLKISYEDKSFTCKLGEMLDNKASITFPCVESRGFVKVFSHDTSGGFFTNDQDALSKNSGDPNAKLYSILNKLEDYRGSDGSFHFKLCYPEVTGIGGSSCNEWFQSSNPTAIGLKYGKIKGFKAISLAFTGGSVGPWKGIGKSVSTTNFIDDAPQSGAWWTAIGARRGHPKGSSKIPGPAPNVVTKVELYVLPAPVSGREICANNQGKGKFTKKCKFPFNYDGKWFDSCTKHKHDSLWCSTKTDENNKHITHEWGQCGDCLKDGPKCNSDWTLFDHTGKCYKYLPTKTDRNEGFSSCQSSHINPTTTLVSIPDKATNDFLTTLTKENAWTGGHRKADGLWGWTDGSLWTFSNWNPGEPNNHGGNEDFVEFQSTGFWNDGSLHPDVKYGRGSLCQYDPATDGYVKVLGHNTAGGLFISQNDALSKNTENPDAYLFSILNQLENYRGKDGNFQFKLCYPEFGQCNVWIQSSNPAVDSTIRGFRSISLSFKTNGARGAWAGLGKSNHGRTLIDDSPAASNWHSAIGSYAYWPQKPKIPGPIGVPPGNNGINVVNLYVKYAACDLGWTYLEHTGQCYKSVETTLTRPQAILKCEAANAKAHLAVIPDKTTNDFVRSIVKERSLIGLSKVSNEWRWADGTKATYTNWMQKEPSGDGPSVEILSVVEGQWNDIPVDSTTYVKGYVCQYNPKPSACDLGWTYLEHTGKCYKHDPTKRSWVEAYGSCRSTSPSSTLSSVHDKTTNDFLAALSGGSSWTWLGGYQDDKENWHWVDGSKWTGYNNWRRGQPDNWKNQEHHLGLNFHETGKWNDYDNIQNPQGSICQYDPGNLKPSVNIMLVGGRSHMEGNVLLSGKPICDDDWDDEDAKVVCRMLGFASDGAIATHHSQFGLVSRDFIMDDVKCQGSETDINDCNHRDTHNCGGHEGAGVRCRMSAECDSGWTYFKHSRKCYKSIKTNMDRADAIKACKESKPTANLVSIHDMTTNAFVQSMVSWRSWIGLQKINGHWVWPDGTKATVTNWVPRQPSGDGTFVEMFADKEGPGKWNDLSSSAKRGAVCQYDIFDVVSSDEDNFSAGDEEFFSPDLEEPQSTCSSNADCPSHLSCIRSVLSSDPGTCGDPWCWREEWDCGSGARCIIVNHHPLCQGTDE